MWELHALRWGNVCDRMNRDGRVSVLVRKSFLERERENLVLFFGLAFSQFPNASSRTQCRLPTRSTLDHWPDGKSFPRGMGWTLGLIYPRIWTLDKHTCTKGLSPPSSQDKESRNSRDKIQGWNPSVTWGKRGGRVRKQEGRVRKQNTQGRWE